MINAIYRRYLTVRHAYADPFDRQRAATLLWMNAVLLLVALASLLVNGTPSPAQTDFDAAGFNNLIAGAGIAIVAINYLLLQTGRVRIAVWLFVGYLALSIAPALLAQFDPGAPIRVAVLVLGAGLMLDRRGFAAVLVLTFAALLLRFLAQNEATQIIRTNPSIWATREFVFSLVAYGISALFLLIFSGNVQRVTRSSFAALQHFRRVGEFPDLISETPDESYILNRALDFIQNELGYDLAQFYLLDEEGKFSRQLRLSYSGAPRRVTLSDGDTSVIGEAARTRATVVLSAAEGGIRAQHLVPPSRQSITIALAERDSVIAVLDVQSNRHEPPTETAVEALVALSKHLARELSYSRSLRDLQAIVREQEAVISRFTREMGEIQGRSHQTSSIDWMRYLQGRGGAAIGFDLLPQDGTLTPIGANEMPDAIREAMLRGDIHVEPGEGEQVVNVPIIFRGLVLGALSLNIPGSHPVSERQLDMIRAVTDRLSVALENNRLFEQTQAQATRERQASEIGSLLLTATNVESVLNIAAESFNEALGAVHTRVYLQPGTLIKSGETA